MSVLITGGTGFIGSHLARRLLKCGKRVVLFDSKPNSANIRDFVNDVSIVQGDVSDLITLQAVVKSQHVEDIFHLAAKLSADCEAEPVSSLQCNLHGTINVLEAARLGGVRKVLYTSSAAVYGPDAKAPAGEDAPRNPTSVYGITKVFCEMWGLYYFRRYGIDFRCIRLIAVIGPHRGNGGLSAFAQYIIQKPAMGEHCEVPLEESSRLAIIYYKDAVNALWRLYLADNPAARIYNIQGISASVGEIAGAVRRQIPSASITFKPKADLVNFYRGVPDQFDDQSARQELGWHCSYALDAMVKDVINVIQAKEKCRQ